MDINGPVHTLLHVHINMHRHLQTDMHACKHTHTHTYVYTAMYIIKHHHTLLTPRNGNSYRQKVFDIILHDNNKLPVDVDGNGCHAQEGDNEKVVQ